MAVTARVRTKVQQSVAEFMAQFPMVMGPGDLMRALNIGSRSWFCQLQREGKFRRFLISSRPIGGKKYSRALVQQYLEGQQ